MLRKKVYLMNNNRNTDHISLLPHETLEDMNASGDFTIKESSTVYTVSTHFDPSGRQSVFDQLKKLLLSD